MGVWYKVVGEIWGIRVIREIRVIRVIKVIRGGGKVRYGS